MLTIQNSRRQNEEITMLDRPTQSKRLLSHTIAEGAYSRRYEHLSPEAIQATKLLSFDSIGCALGGSQQDDAKICWRTIAPRAATTAPPLRLLVRSLSLPATGKFLRNFGRQQNQIS
jgi:hypothetical protein